jgi:small GTP-binding protein
MSGNEIKMKIIRLALLGDSSVGKTSIISAFLGYEFNEDFISTIGWDKRKKTIKLENGKNIELSIWDTAGQERFHSIALKVIRKAQGIVVVFDLTKRETFESVVNWLEIIKENFNEVTIILFGNKCDCESSRQVTTEEATQFAHKKNMPYFETSAKKNINIEAGFSKIANDIYKKHNKVEKAITLDSKGKNREEKSCCSGGKSKKTDKKKEKNENKKEDKNVESEEKEKK